MDLSRRCARSIDARDWQRGEAYYRSGAVTILARSLEATSLEADVQGSLDEPYRVRLDWSQAARQRLLVYCSCPRFDDVGVCKHVAATLLAVSREFKLDVPGTRNLVLHAIDVEQDEIGPSNVESYDDWDEDDSRFGAWDEDEETDDGSSVGSGANRSVRHPAQRNGARAASNLPGWKKQLGRIASAAATAWRRRTLTHGNPWSRPRQFFYVLDVARALKNGRLAVTLYQRVIKKNGQPGKLKPAQLSKDELSKLPSTEDRTLIEMLAGNDRAPYYYSFGDYYKLSEFSITGAMAEILLPRLSASGRFGLLSIERTSTEDSITPLAWDDGPAWNLMLEVTKSTDRKHWQVQGRLHRGDDHEDLNRPVLLLANGVVVFPDKVARFDPGVNFEWVSVLRGGVLSVPVKQEQEFVARLATMPNLPEVSLPAALRWKEVRQAPLPRLKITRPKNRWQQDLECRLSFQYGAHTATPGDGVPAWYDRESRCLLRRDDEAERQACEQLIAAGARRPPHYAYDNPDLYHLVPDRLPEVAARLAAADWQLDADGGAIRRAGRISIHVASGVDWFDLEGTCDFGGFTASLPELLAAVRRGEQLITLSDGSRGLLPSEWLARFGSLAELGQVKQDRLRFLPSQATLLDALLAAQDSKCVEVDKAFARIRSRLRTFDGIRKQQEPRSFAGELRGYQREGLGWLRFLDDLGVGGCLADDMGLGKTVQVLALLESRRPKRSRQSDASRASLVVVPRSLVFNWMEEAARFAPKLRVLNYTGLDRGQQLDRLAEVDLVVTTYGTLRRDIAKLREVEFDYAILDEAQAIKNAASQANKACRLLRARRRLAMTGTPLENHLGEIWSLFEFLNPGMLGRNQKLHEVFAASRERVRLADDNGEEQESSDGLALLRQALRPYLLRRTKQQVLSELPPKTEQTLYCELAGDQQKQYRQLRDHYRQSLLARVERVGFNKSKIHVLEALLRLRQAACHVGLLDKSKADAPSAKLETLLEQLDEVLAEGHKAIVFSQFTSFLAIVRRHLDQRQLDYEYLDGRTTKRQAKVERFQTDPACKLFLISLKAGGLGLNLTAADYVFILDPWWNPAIEAQAVDRAHRIGQQRHVFAYRLIARDTVEEKILQLQEHKRGLADAIITADRSLVRNLTTADLQLLLS